MPRAWTSARKPKSLADVRPDLGPEEEPRGRQAWTSAQKPKSLVNSCPHGSTPRQHGPVDRGEEDREGDVGRQDPARRRAW